MLISYTPDANNAAPSAVCDSYTISQASPTLTGSGGATVTVGHAVSDTATVAGGYTPGGSITFGLYPGGICSGTQIGSASTVTVSGNGSYPSGTIATPTSAGTDSVLISYTPDANNTAPSAVCDSYTISQASPTLTGSAPTSGQVGY